MVGRETSLLVENVEIVSNFLIYFSSIYEEVKWYLEEYLQSRQLEPPLSLYACRYSQLTGLGTEERIIPSLYLDILYKKRPSLCCPFFVFPSRLKERSEWQTGTNTRYVHAWHDITAHCPFWAFSLFVFIFPISYLNVFYCLSIEMLPLSLLCTSITATTSRSTVKTKTKTEKEKRKVCLIRHLLTYINYKLHKTRNTT